MSEEEPADTSNESPLTAITTSSNNSSADNSSETAPNSSGQTTTTMTTTSASSSLSTAAVAAAAAETTAANSTTSTTSTSSPPLPSGDASSGGGGGNSSSSIGTGQLTASAITTSTATTTTSTTGADGQMLGDPTNATSVTSAGAAASPPSPAPPPPPASSEPPSASCDSVPDFAVVCSFLDRFGAALGIQWSIKEVQIMLEQQGNVSEQLIDIHVKLLRKIVSSATKNRFDRYLARFCEMYLVPYDHKLVVQVLEHGYTKLDLVSRVHILKNLLEMQFDFNPKFKAMANERSPEELRLLPLGRDADGMVYWLQVDEDLNVRMYTEDLDDENSFQLLHKTKEELAELLAQLKELKANKFQKSTSSVKPKSLDEKVKEEKKPDAASALQEGRKDKQEEARDTKADVKIKVEKIKDETPELKSDVKLKVELLGSTDGSSKRPIKGEVAYSDKKELVEDLCTRQSDSSRSSSEGHPVAVIAKVSATKLDNEAHHCLLPSKGDAKKGATSSDGRPEVAHSASALSIVAIDRECKDKDAGDLARPDGNECFEEGEDAKATDLSMPHLPTPPHEQEQRLPAAPQTAVHSPPVPPKKAQRGGDSDDDKEISHQAAEDLRTSGKKTKSGSSSSSSIIAEQAKDVEKRSGAEKARGDDEEADDEDEDDAATVTRAPAARDKKHKARDVDKGKLARSDRQDGDSATETKADRRTEGNNRQAGDVGATKPADAERVDRLTEKSKPVERSEKDSCVGDQMEEDGEEGDGGDTEDNTDDVRRPTAGEVSTVDKDENETMDAADRDDEDDASKKSKGGPEEDEGTRDVGEEEEKPRKRGRGRPRKGQGKGKARGRPPSSSAKKNNNSLTEGTTSISKGAPRGRKKKKDKDDDDNDEQDKEEEQDETDAKPKKKPGKISREARILMEEAERLNAEDENNDESGIRPRRSCRMRKSVAKFEVPISDDEASKKEKKRKSKADKDEEKEVVFSSVAGINAKAARKAAREMLKAQKLAHKELMRKLKKKRARKGGSQETEDEVYDSVEEMLYGHEEEEDEAEMMQFGPDDEDEFACDEDITEGGADAEEVKKARTAAQDDADACRKCGKADHPEFILLCDTCDEGWHMNCLRPPLLVIPLGNWYCPPCEHSALISALDEKINFIESEWEKRQKEITRKQRLAFVSINIGNVLPVAKRETTTKKKRNAKKEDYEDDDSEVSDRDSSSESESSRSEQSVASAPRRRRAARRGDAMREKMLEYDKLMKEAIDDDEDFEEESEEELDADGNVKKHSGKDMSNILPDSDEERKAGRRRRSKLSDMNAIVSDDDSEFQASDFSGEIEINRKKKNRSSRRPRYDSYDEEEDSEALSDASWGRANVRSKRRSSGRKKDVVKEKSSKKSGGGRWDDFESEASQSFKASSDDSGDFCKPRKRQAVNYAESSDDDESIPQPPRRRKKLRDSDEEVALDESEEEEEPDDDEVDSPDGDVSNEEDQRAKSDTESEEYEEEEDDDDDDDDVDAKAAAAAGAAGGAGGDALKGKIGPSKKVGIKRGALMGKHYKGGKSTKKLPLKKSSGFGIRGPNLLHGIHKQKKLVSEGGLSGGDRASWGSKGAKGSADEAGNCTGSGAEGSGNMGSQHDESEDDLIPRRRTTNGRAEANRARARIMQEVENEQKLDEEDEFDDEEEEEEQKEEIPEEEPPPEERPSGDELPAGGPNEAVDDDDDDEAPHESQKAWPPLPSHLMANIAKRMKPVLQAASGQPGLARDAAIRGFPLVGKPMRSMMSSDVLPTAAPSLTVASSPSSQVLVASAHRPIIPTTASKSHPRPAHLGMPSSKHPLVGIPSAQGPGIPTVQPGYPGHLAHPAHSGAVRHNNGAPRRPPYPAHFPGVSGEDLATSTYGYQHPPGYAYGQQQYAFPPHMAPAYSPVAFPGASFAAESFGNEWGPSSPQAQVVAQKANAAASVAEDNTPSEHFSISNILHQGEGTAEELDPVASIGNLMGK